MAQTTTITIRLAPQEVARLDEMRGGGVSRSGFVRELLRRSGPLDDAATHAESIRLLAESARAGKVPAQVALERALRADGRDEPAGELARLLRGE
jgi:hypothetical protein